MLMRFSGGYRFHNTDVNVAVAIDMLGRVGIGTTTPNYPLTFNTDLGDKIALWSVSPDNYGFGVQSGLLQIHSDNINSDIGFGFGNSVAFNETMRIKGNGNVGIGTSTPLARLHVKDSSVLFSATGGLPATPGNIPISGSGRRMLWYADKAAFRAGYIDGTQWNKDSIGNYSFASGYNTKAKGFGSVAMGTINSATGDYSISIGTNTRASGLISTAMGSNSNAIGDYSTTMGHFTAASGIYSVAMGYYTTASGFNSTAMGFVTTASGSSSTSLGFLTKAKSGNSLVIGQFNDTTAVNSLFEIGNGASDATRNNALTVLNNGNTGIGTISPGTRLHVMNGSSGYAGGYFPGITLEGSGNTYFDFLAPAGNESGVLFGKPTDAAAGGIVYNNAGNPNSLDFRTNGNVTRMLIYGNGNAWLQGTLTQASDARLKKNIALLQDPLQKIIQLHGYNYHWKNENADSRLQTGVLAQEVQKLFPELVTANKEGILAVNYSGLIPVMIESIKEQQKQIDELKKLVEKILK
jgi:hypothetical protein